MPDLCAVSSGDPQADRFDVLVHALAQLPDDVSLRLCGVPDTGSLHLLARAYGVEERLRFADSPNGESTLLVHARAADGAGAGTDRVVFDPQGDPLDDSDGLTLAELVHRLGDGRPAAFHGEDQALAGARVAIITNLPAPYRMPLFSAVGRRLSAAGAELRVLFLAGGETDRPWIGDGDGPDFGYETLRSVRASRGARPRLLPLNLEAALFRFRPTIVVCGGLSPGVALRASLAASALRASFGVWSGDHPRMPTAQSRLRAVARRLVLSRSRFALAYGSLGGEYLHAVRNELPVVLARNTSRLVTQPACVEPVAGTVRLLAVGDLASRRKGIDIVLAALRLLPDLDCRLTVIGGGALLPQLATAAEADGRVLFRGAVSPKEIGAEYGGADVFLFPSRQDVFGLALVEAMQAGLPTVSSVNPGAIADLCVHEANCLLVQTDSPDDWARAIDRVAGDGDLRRTLSVAARRTIAERWTNEHSADAFIAGLRLATLVGAPS